MIKGIEISDENKGLWRKLCFQKMSSLVFKLSSEFNKVFLKAGFREGMGKRSIVGINCKRAS
jgi:hypothetical protein